MAFSIVPLAYLLALPLLIALWIGVLAIRRTRRTGAWWTMLAGVICSSLGALYPVAAFLLVALNGSSSGPAPASRIIAGTALPLFGSLLFAIGFALHGLKAAAAANRQRELEELTTAMSAEIEILRRGGPTA